MPDLLYNPDLPEVSLFIEQDKEVSLSIEVTGEVSLTVEVDPIVRDPATLLRPVQFIQAVASALWVVPHNLGYKPDVMVYSTGGVEVMAEVLHVDDNNLTITFSSPFAGRARLF